LTMVDGHQRLGTLDTFGSALPLSHKLREKLRG
jgi:hypothetical protein